jgi:hypothetical protein
MRVSHEVRLLSWFRLRAFRSAVCLVLAATAACDTDDPFRPVATVPNVVTGLDLAALSTGSVAPTAIDFLSLRAVRPVVDGTGGINFQLAVDLDASNRVRLLPVLAVLSPPTASSSIGLLRAPQPFELVTRAPTGGFAADSAVTTAPGETWIVRITAGVCPFGDPYYAKLVVDDINTVTRRLFVRFLLNRNCGYRDLVEGLPRN